MDITGTPLTWRELQIKVADILSICGFKAEVEKKIHTARGIVEVDVYAVDEKTIPPSIFICECKFWDTNIPQEKIHTLHSIVINSGAHYGILISKSGYQAGAITAADYTNISLFNWQEFCQIYHKRYVEKWYEKFEPISKQLFHFTDYLKTTYDDIYITFSKDEKVKARALVVAYSEYSFFHAKKYLAMNWPYEEMVLEDIKRYYPSAKTLNEFFDYIETKCLEGLHAFCSLYGLEKPRE